jgi:hypothetical protein
MPPRRLLLYTKPAVAGRVKTRLAGELTPAGAAALHRAFHDDLAERLVAAEARGELELWSAWALAEGEELPGGPGRPIRQQGSGLGERLLGGLALAAGAGGGAEAVAALGSDHPTVPLAAVREAFDRLAAGADLVLGPSCDGGYFLIALRPPAVRPELFRGVPWSTERVLAETLARAAALGLAVELLEAGSDVDTPDDLRRLARDLAGDPAAAARCPRTRDLLAAWGYLAAPHPVGQGPPYALVEATSPAESRGAGPRTSPVGQGPPYARGAVAEELSKQRGGVGASLAPREGGEGPRERGVVR